MASPAIVKGILLGALLSAADGAADVCLTGLAYGTAQQRGLPRLDIQTAAACKAACKSAGTCKYFTFTASATQCWLIGELFEFHIEESATSGPVRCHIDEVAPPEVGKVRLQKIMSSVVNLTTLVEEAANDATTRQEAQSLKAHARTGELSIAEFREINKMITLLSKLVGSPMELAARHGALISIDDLDYLASEVLGQDVPLETQETALEVKAVAGECTGACDESTDQYGAGTAWPNAEVKYCYDNSLAYSSREAILCAMQEIKKHTPGITFTNVGYQKLNYCNERPAVYIQSNGLRSGNGCWADMGMQSSFLGANQKMNLQAPGCDNCGTATHEMLHAMGMAHEQSRPDRDTYVQILWQNIKPGMAAQFAVHAGADTGRPYDIMSIMHYGENSFSAYGAPTIAVKPEGYALYSSSPSAWAMYKIGQRMGQSKQDVSQLHAVYGCDGPGQNCQPLHGGNLLPIILGLVAALLVLVLCAVGVCCLMRGRHKGSNSNFQRLHR
mmetsp:Transcript_16307/g.38568  ORF Transcript_16307/g.38568 Transcript_16307/m.38568 type:complete len:501 (+) Transcript_16307:3-1505(+)